VPDVPVEKLPLADEPPLWLKLFASLYDAD